MKFLYKLIFVFIVLAIASGCATKKKKSDQDYGKIKEVYHNMSSKYNGFWNAEEIMKKSLLTLNEQHQSDYSKILSVYPYIDVDNASVVSSDMDIVMKKMKRIVKLHSKSDWIDDTYVMLGRAQYLKQDYETAEETFQYFEEEFNPNNPNSRLYNKDKNKKADKEEKDKKKKIEKKLKDEKIKEAKKEKQESREDKDEARKEKRAQIDKFKKELKDLKDDLRKATKKRKEDEKKAREKARKKKKRIKKDPNADPRSSKEKELEAKIEAKQKQYDQYLLEGEKKKEEEEKAKLEEEEKEEEEELLTDEEKAKKEEEARKKRNIRQDDPKGLFKGKRAFHEGMFWLARTYIERENYFSADYIFKKLLDEYPTKDHVKKMIPAAKAHMFIEQEEYDRAVPFLEQAITFEKEKSLKARYSYILGQIHQRGGRETEARAAFEKVNKFKPDYDLKFNSQLNLAKAEWKSGQSTKEASIRKLEKMLKDKKNLDFQDQIYYTIGEIHEADNDINNAITAYQSSIQTSVNNAKQKTNSYYSIAQLLFQKERYVEASAYFDSTLTVINKKDERFFEVQNYSGSLKEIAANIQIIDLQDSLLMLSQKSPEELDKILEKIAKENQEALAAASEGGNAGASGKTNSRLDKGFGRNESSFFAYNAPLVAAGKKMFEKKWGGRQLSDDWRRSNRLGAESLDIEEEEVVDEQAVLEEAIALLRSTVPTDPGKKAKVLKKREDALFILGKLFRDKIQNNLKCVETLNTLLDDYPTTPYEPDALFYLYLANDALGNTGLAQSQKSKLTTKFPNAKFAQSISDPNYLDNLDSERDADENLYTDTYQIFQNGQHDVVLKNVEEAFEKFDKGNPLLPKFALLQSMSLGKVNGKEAYIESLQKLVARYPNTVEETRAKEILRFIRGDEKAFDGRFYDELSEDFTTDDTKLHYILVVIYDWSEKALQDAKIKISNYNKEFHQLEKLRISDLPLNKEEGTQLILIRKFRNKDKAMKYYTGTLKNSDKFLDPNKTGFDIFASTQKNYREIAKKKGILEYRPFFEKYYLSEDKGK